MGLDGVARLVPRSSDASEAQARVRINLDDCAFSPREEHEGVHHSFILCSMNARYWEDKKVGGGESLEGWIDL